MAKCKTALRQVGLLKSDFFEKDTEDSQFQFTFTTCLLYAWFRSKDSLSPLW